MYGIAWNLATRPWRLAFWTYVAVTSGSFLTCRYAHRFGEQQFRMLKEQAAVNDYNLIRDTPLGQEMDQQWARDALNKKTNVRDFREDAVTDKDSPGLVRG